VVTVRPAAAAAAAVAAAAAGAGAEEGAEEERVRFRLTAAAGKISGLTVWEKSAAVSVVPFPPAVVAKCRVTPSKV